MSAYLLSQSGSKVFFRFFCFKLVQMKMTLLTQWNIIREKTDGKEDEILFFIEIPHILENQLEYRPFSPHSTPIPHFASHPSLPSWYRKERHFIDLFACHPSGFGYYISVCGRGEKGGGGNNCEFKQNCYYCKSFLFILICALFIIFYCQVNMSWRHFF